VDMSTIHATYSEILSFDLPEGILLANDTEEAYVKYTIETYADRSFTFSEPDIVRAGLLEDHQAVFDVSEPLVVTLHGKTGEVNAIEADQVMVIADLTSCGLGDSLVNLVPGLRGNVGDSITCSINVEEAMVNINLILDDAEEGENLEHSAENEN